MGKRVPPGPAGPHEGPEATALRDALCRAWADDPKLLGDLLAEALEPLAPPKVLRRAQALVRVTVEMADGETRWRLARDLLENPLDAATGLMARAKEHLAAPGRRKKAQVIATNRRRLAEKRAADEAQGRKTAARMERQGRSRSEIAEMTGVTAKVIRKWLGPKGKQAV